MTHELLARVAAARPVTIGVVGDLILDRYLRGETRRISPEAPIPVLDVGAEDLRLGGAGNVAANLLVAGARVWVAGVTGDDASGALLRDKLKEAGADVSAVVTDGSRPTVEKTRLIARSQQVLRVDREHRQPLAPEVVAAFLEPLRARLRGTDMLVVSDYAKGTLAPRVLDLLLRESDVPALVDPKGTDYARYRGAFGVTPNRGEAEAAAGLSIRDSASLNRAAARLFELVGARAVFITLGEEGIFCAPRDGAPFHVQSEARTVFDVTGAGDTVIALLARYLAAGLPLESAVRVANAGAGVVVGKLGAGTVTPAELARALGDGGAPGFDGKIVGRAELPALISGLKANALRVVLTNGCFDLLHAGHARSLAMARAQGDVLVVALNSDASVARLKGPGRPLVPFQDRAVLLAALAAVDHVVGFDEDTPEALIREVTPDVLVKGDDYAGKPIAGREWVEAHGGRVVLAPLLEGRSTTDLIERIESMQRSRSGP